MLNCALTIKPRGREIRIKIFKCKCVPNLLPFTVSWLSGSPPPPISLSTQTLSRKPRYNILDDIRLPLKNVCHKRIHENTPNITYHETKFNKTPIIS